MVHVDLQNYLDSKDIYIFLYSQKLERGFDSFDSLVLWYVLLCSSAEAEGICSSFCGHLEIIRKEIHLVATVDSCIYDLGETKGGANQSPFHYSHQSWSKIQGTPFDRWRFNISLGQSARKVTNLPTLSCTHLSSLPPQNTVM